jgi:2-phospho-L-lactate guanylyltransferase
MAARYRAANDRTCSAYAHAVLAVVPVKGLEGAKSRLAPALGPSGRARLVERMLDVVLDACEQASSVGSILVVTPDPALARGHAVLQDEGIGQGPALALALADARAADGALVVMADCPYATAAALDRLVAAADPLALVPARDGGTSALALHDPSLLRPAFGVPGSAALTIARARAAGIVPAVLDDEALAFDVDLPADLARARHLLAA